MKRMKSKMNISIIGLGYVGLVTGLGFAELGCKVNFVDIDSKKIDKLNCGKSPIYEEEIDELLERNIKRIKASLDYGTIINSDLILICVGTPSNPDGSIDLEHIESAVRNVGGVLSKFSISNSKSKNSKKPVVVVKSTVLPGTTEDFIKPILEKSSGKKAFEDFGLAVNPEFLREGEAIYDFFNPDRIVLGVKDDFSKKALLDLYSPFDCPKLITDLKTAEMIKYASNAFLATKISFANEIGNICKKLGIDSYEVFKGVGLDHRINPSFFRAGIGFGGSCFPKDVKALISKAKEVGITPEILNATIKINEKQPIKMIELLKKHLGDLKNRRIGILGLAFKPGTDDVRESRAIVIVDRLLAEGAKIVAYDPKAMDNFRRIFGSDQIVYASSASKVLECNAILIVTEWKEFEKLDYKGKVVIDGRRVEKARKEASIYEGVCW
jgi:UDPglucose 6-dehydrogenase